MRASFVVGSKLCASEVTETVGPLFRQYTAMQFVLELLLERGTPASAQKTQPHDTLCLTCYEIHLRRRRPPMAGTHGR